MKKETVDYETFKFKIEQLLVSLKQLGLDNIQINQLIQEELSGYSKNIKEHFFLHVSNLID